jgi:hypothetical protein
LAEKISKAPTIVFLSKDGILYGSMVKGEHWTCSTTRLVVSQVLRFFGLSAIAALFCLVFVSCPIETDSSDEINSKLDSTLKGLPANTADNPHTIVFSVSELTGIRGALNANPTKYVYLDLSGSTFTSIGNYAFSNETTWKGCTTLVGITIPDSVTSIGIQAFDNCPSLASVTFHSVIPSNGFPYNRSSRDAPPPPPPTFPGDLVAKYLAVGGGIGTYTRTPPSTTWTKQP